jgi:hypothetical protein
MNKPYRLTSVTVVLDAYRNVLASIAEVVVVAKPVACRAAQRASEYAVSAARWLVRPVPEMEHTYIRDRIKSARAR